MTNVQPPYWLDRDRGVCWCIIPKCASTTLDVVLGSDNRVSRDAALESGLPVVAFVRHPWKRIVSALTHPLATHPDYRVRLEQHVVGKAPEAMDVHVRPQSWFLDGFAIAYLGLVGSMAQGWERLAALIGPLPQLVHENRKPHPEWWEIDFEWDSLLPTYAGGWEYFERAQGGA